MAKQIKRSEIAEKDLYLEIRESAEKTIEYIEYLNESLGDTAKVLQSKLKKPLKVTMEGLEAVNTTVGEMNDTMQKSIELDEAKSKALKVQADAEIKIEKLAQEQIKTEEKAIKLQKDKIKLDKEQKKLEQQEIARAKKLESLSEEAIRLKIKEQKAQRDLKKELADQLILEDKNAGTLEKLGAKNRQLARARQKLNLETIEGQEALKKINDEIDENNEVIQENSDKLKKQKMNVGNYTESIEKATGELGGLIKNIATGIKGLKDQAKAFKLQAKAADSSAKKIRLVGKAIKATGIGLIIALLGSLVSSFGDTREEAQMMGNTMKKITGSIKLIGSSIRGFFENFGLKFDAFMVSMELGMANIKNFFGDYDAEVSALLKKQKKINDKIEANQTINIGLDSFGEMSRAIDQITMDTFRLENAMAKTGDEIERLRGQEDLLSEKTGDMTLTFNQQLQAQKEYNDTVEKRIGLEKQLVDDKVDLKALEIRSSLIKAGREYSIEQIKNLTFLENEADWMKINSDALNELSDAKTEQIAKENELNLLQAKNAMERRNTLKDLFEKELDYAIDAFDVNKSINERIINNENTTLEERERLTEETRKLADSAFQNQIALTEEYTGQRIDFEALTKMTDEAEIRRTLKKNKLNETTLTRILEIIKERKIAEQDLEDLEVENAKKRQERDNAILESKEAIREDDVALSIEQAEKLFDTEKELRDKSFDDEKIKNAKSVKELEQHLDDIYGLKKKQLEEVADFEKKALDREVMDADERAQKKKEIDEKLQNDIIRLDEETVEAKKDLGEDEVENQKKVNEKKTALDNKRKDEQIAILQALTDISNDLADKRIAKIDEEIEASQKRYDNMVELANAGNLTAQESLATEQKLIAEANKKKEKEERRKQRMQLASSVLQTYLQNSQDPKVENPLAKTITDTVLLTEFIKSLPAFAEGTDDTGKNGRGIDGKGGFHAILHPNERVMTKEQNALTGSMSNKELSQLAYNYQNGLVRDITDGSIASNDVYGTNILVDKLDSLEATIRNKPESNIELEQIIDGAMSISRSTRTGNTKVYNRYRINK